MNTSQNGWPVHKTQAGLVALHYVTGRVAPEAYPIFLHFCAWFDTTIERIRKDASWGWAYRPIRGNTTGYSNHASGTAIDLNAPDHPMGKFNTFEPHEQKLIRTQLHEYDGVLHWGGEWTRRPDDMHFEIVGTPAQVADVIAKLNAAPTKPAPPPTSSTLKRGSRGDAVYRLQTGLNRIFPAYRHVVAPKGKLLVADGIFGSHTEAWVKEFQRRVDLTVDGIVGRNTRNALARFGIRP